MKASKLLGIAGIGYLLYEIGKDKYEEFAVGFKDSLDMIKYDIKNISSLDFKYSGKPRILFNMDLKITNPSEVDFSMNGGQVINLKRIDIISKQNEKLATITPNINQIQLPPGESVTLDNLPVEIPLAKLGNLLDSFINDLEADQQHFGLRLNVVVAGSEFVINSKA